MHFKSEELKIVRSRLEDVIETGDIAVDIGKRFEPKIGRFDHHQEDFLEKRDNGIPYAAFGLVWREFGSQITGNDDVVDIVDLKLVAPLDASDNGVDVCTLSGAVEPYDIPKMIASMNPVFFEVHSDEDRHVSFMKAVDIAKTIIQREIVCAEEKIKTREILKKAYDSASDKKIVILDEKMFWEDDAIEMCPDTFFIVFPYTKTVWAAKAIRKNKGTFASRKTFPEAWAGKNNSDLQELSGVPDARFCHKALFMASADSKEGVLKLAEIAIKS